MLPLVLGACETQRPMAEDSFLNIACPKPNAGTGILSSLGRGDDQSAVIPRM